MFIRRLRSMANSGGRVDDCKRRELGAKPLRRVSSTGLRHGSQGAGSRGARCRRSQESASLGSLGAGTQDIQGPGCRVVSKTPMKAVMVTSMGEGDRAVRGRPFTLRGNSSTRVCRSDLMKHTVPLVTNVFKDRPCVTNS